MRRTGWADRVLTLAGADGEPAAGSPPAGPVVAATALSVGASLGADALLVAAGTSLFPSTAGYAHFRFTDYAALTVIGVAAAGAAWPAVTRITSAPRRLFLRLAVAVSAVLLLPDAWLLGEGQPADAVAVLVAMHLAIAVLTYNLLVRVAPARTRPPAVQGGRPRPAPSGAGLAPAAPAERRPRWTRAPWITMAVLVGLATALGIAALVAVPLDRPDAWLPAGGRAVYLAHAVAGLLLGLGAPLLLVAKWRADRLARYSALAGLVGTGFGAGGGVLAVYQSGRIAGMGLMLLGAIVAGFAYLTPVGAGGDGPDVEGRGAPTAAADEWDDGGGRPLACTHCDAVAVEAGKGLPSADSAGGEGWAAAAIAAGICPLCPDQPLQPYRDVAVCECCETVYRRLPDDDGGTTWAATPGRRVSRR